MSKIKMLLDVVEDMRSLADSIEVLANGMASGNIPKQLKEAPKPEITHEMLRELAIEITRNGKREDVKSLISHYGVKNITAVSDSDLEGFYADLLLLKDGDNNAAK